MPTWIETITGKSRSSSKGAPQSFEVRCSCRNMLMGTRTSRSQSVVCDQCGSSRFILARSSYPKPRRGSRKSRRQKVNFNPTKIISELMLAVGSYSKAGVTKTSGFIFSTARYFVKCTRDFFTPVRSIVIILGLIVISTIWYTVQSRAYDKAEIDFRLAAAHAEKLLKKDDLKGATEQYQIADKALKVLGIKTALDRKVHQYAAETNAIDKLCVKDISQIIEEAARYHSRGELKTWHQRSGSLYLDGWFIFDTHISKANIVRETSKEQKELIWIKIPYHSEKKSIALKFLIPHQEELLDEGVSVRVIFAAQMESCFPSSNIESEWTATFNPETSFLWCHERLLEDIGFEDGDWTGQETILDITTHQSELAGIPLQDAAKNTVKNGTNVLDQSKQNTIGNNQQEPKQ